MASSSSEWYFTKEQLESTPSRQSGVEPEKELFYIQQTAYFIQDKGQKLKLSQLCINTAIIYMHRFYVFHSFTLFQWKSIAAAALLLAAKIEEQPRKVEHVNQVVTATRNPCETSFYTYYESYLAQTQDLVFNESILLRTLGFDVVVDHPHTHVLRCCYLLRASKDLAQTSYFMASNSLHLTTMCLQYKPTVVACFCIYFVCKWSKWEIPLSNEKKEWFSYVDETVTFELLEQLTKEFLFIYDRCSSQLKEKIMAIADGLSSHNSGHPSSSLKPDKKFLTFPSSEQRDDHGHRSLHGDSKPITMEDFKQRTRLLHEPGSSRQHPDSEQEYQEKHIWERLGHHIKPPPPNTPSDKHAPPQHDHPPVDTKLSKHGHPFLMDHPPSGRILKPQDLLRKVSMDIDLQDKENRESLAKKAQANKEANQQVRASDKHAKQEKVNQTSIAKELKPPNLNPQFNTDSVPFAPIMNRIETNPSLISMLLKDTASVPYLPVLAATAVTEPKEQMQHYEEHKENKEEKHKHEDKEKNREEKEKKKKKYKNKHCKKHKHKHRKHDRPIEASTQPVEVTISKDKIQPAENPTSLGSKIQIPKDSIKTHAIGMLLKETVSVPYLPALAATAVAEPKEQMHHYEEHKENKEEKHKHEDKEKNREEEKKKKKKHKHKHCKKHKHKHRKHDRPIEASTQPVEVTIPKDKIQPAENPKSLGLKIQIPKDSIKPDGIGESSALGGALQIKISEDIITSFNSNEMCSQKQERDRSLPLYAPPSKVFKSNDNRLSEPKTAKNFYNKVSKLNNNVGDPAMHTVQTLDNSMNHTNYLGYASQNALPNYYCKYPPTTMQPFPHMNVPPPFMYQQRYPPSYMYPSADLYTAPNPSLGGETPPALPIYPPPLPQDLPPFFQDLPPVPQDPPPFPQDPPLPQDPPPNNPPPPPPIC